MALVEPSYHVDQFQGVRSDGLAGPVCSERVVSAPPDLDGIHVGSIVG
jgi:hypothetical protein